MLAMFGCASRGIELGPINTFKGWQALGRFVKKGSKAIALCMPVTCKNADKPDKNGDPAVYTRFIFRNNWFTLSQTEGKDFVPDAVPDWSKESALKALEIEEIPFASINGNSQGYAIARKVAVSPLAQLPFKTLFHELAHVVLGHTEAMEMNDSETLTRDVKELEAEGTALLCLEALNLPGSEFCRGYIQNWFKGEKVPEANAKRIIVAAGKILKAGQPIKKEVQS